MDVTRLVESAQYVTNYGGQQIAVMLPIDIWDGLLEVLQNGEEQTEGVEDRIMGEDDDWIPSMAEIVARIKAAPPNPAVKFATGSVDDLTPSEPEPEFDLEAWERDWAYAMEDFRRTNYIAERNKRIMNNNNMDEMMADGLPEEILFDYAKAKPNRFAVQGEVTDVPICDYTKERAQWLGNPSLDEIAANIRGCGTYTEERDKLFGDQTLDDLLSQIQERRECAKDRSQQLEEWRNRNELYN